MRRLYGIRRSTVRLSVGSAASLSSIAVTPSNPTLTTASPASTQQFTATGTYSDGTTRDLTTNVTWTSGTVAAATIGAATGLATWAGPGSSTITATLGAISGNTTLTTTLPDAAHLWVWAYAGTATVDGSNNVSAMNDQSGSGVAARNFVQATDSLRPAYTATDANFNNKPSVRGGSSDMRLAQGTNTALPQPFTIYIVYRLDVTNAARFMYDSTSGKRDALYSSGTGVFRLFTSSEGDASDDDAGVSPNTSTHVACTIWNGNIVAGSSSTGTRLFVDNSQTAVSFPNSTITDQNPTLFILGNSVNANSAGCAYAEVIIYSAAHDAATRQAVMKTYLGPKYGVTTT